MKRRFILLVIISFILILSSCSGNAKMTSIRIEELDETLYVDDLKELKVKDNNDKIVPNTDLLWSTSDAKVATISKKGVVNIKSEGYVVITAKYKKDLSINTSLAILSPYDVVEATNEFVGGVEDDYKSAGLIDSIAKYGYKYGKMILKSLAGKVNSVFSTITSFIDKDVYMFSQGTPYLNVKDGIIYTITDWTNETCHFSLDDIETIDLYESVRHNLIEKGEQGKSFEDLLVKIKSELVNKVANDGCYHLDKMVENNPNMVYRIVIRADYVSYKMVDYYNNGLIVGAVLSIKDVLNWDLEKVANNFCYTKVQNEIFDINNIRICVEYMNQEKGE